MGRVMRGESEEGGRVMRVSDCEKLFWVLHTHSINVLVLNLIFSLYDRESQ